MAKNKQAKSAIPHIQNLLEDDYLQEQVRNALGGMRQAYVRARAQRGRAPEDKRLYANLRQTAISVRNAAGTLRRPDPPPSHRGRRIAVIALAVGGCAWLTAKMQKIEWQRKGGGSGQADAHSATNPNGAAQPDPTTEARAAG
jgi:ferric-dicitrate binding protein FerR (iron transport regulator)